MSHTTDVDSVSNDVVAVCTHILPAAAYSLLVSYRTIAEWPLDPLWHLVATSSCSLTSLPSSDISLYQMTKVKHLWLEQYQQAVNHLTSGFLSWNLVPFSSNRKFLHDGSPTQKSNIIFIAFEAQTSVKGGAHTRSVDAWIPDKST